MEYSILVKIRRILKIFQAFRDFRGLGRFFLILSFSPILVSWISLYPQRDLTDAGNAALILGKHEEAIKMFSQAYELDKKNIISIFNLATAYHYFGEFSEAEALYQKGIAIALENKDYRLLPHLYYNLGNTQYKKEDYAQAMENYKKAMNLDEEDRQIKKNFELAFLKSEENQSVQPNSPKSPEQKGEDNPDNQNTPQKDTPQENSPISSEKNQSSDQGQAEGGEPPPQKSANKDSDSGNRGGETGTKTSDSTISFERAEQILSTYENRQKKFEAFRKYRQTSSPKPIDKNW